ncbi:MAG: hypothetical protein ABID87_00255 [Chloroflexota bacterium]
MSEKFPTRTVGLEVVSCTDPAREAEFFWWFRKVHIPDLKATPGIVDVYRYRDIQYDFSSVPNNFGRGFMTPEGVPSRYLTLLRINSEDPWALMQQIKEDDGKRAKQGRIIDCYRSYEMSVWDFVAYRRTVQPPVRPETNLPDGMPEAILVVMVNVAPDMEDLFYEWWLDVHAYDLVEEPGVVQGSRFRTMNPAPAEDEPNTMLIYEIDADDPGAGVKKVFTDEMTIRRPAGRSDPQPNPRPRPTFARGLFQHVDHPVSISSENR